MSPLMRAAYDPDEPEGARRPSDLVNLKDAKILAIVLIVLGLALWPIYTHFRREGQKSVSIRNLRASYDAIQAYSVNFNDRFPPAFNDDGTGTPQVYRGHVVGWPTVVGPYMSTSWSFRSPGAEADEVAKVLNGKSAAKPLEVTYGMYRSLSGVPASYVPDPAQTVLLAESSNRGAKGSYDPMPFEDAEGAPLDDAFVIGWNNGNNEYSAETQHVSRLAFRNVVDGDFSKPSVEGRYGPTVYAISTDGKLLSISPSQTRVTYSYPTLTGRWWANLRVYQ